MRILIVESGDVCYGSVYFFEHLYGNAFTTLGCDVVYKRYSDIISEIGQVDAVLLFNYDLSVTTKSGDYLLDLFDVPIFYMLLDHPYYVDLTVKLRNLCVVCLDYNHIDYIKMHHPHIKTVIFGYLTGEKIVRDYSIINRPVDILFSGTYLNENKQLDIIKEQPAIMQKMCLQIIELLIENPDIAIEYAFYYIVEQYNYDVENIDLSIIENGVFIPVDKFMRAYYRHKVVETLIKSELPFTICGAGWDELIKSLGAKNVTNLGVVAFNNSFKIIGDSKITINVMPLFKNGMHDRVLTTMINGGVCVTDTSNELLRNYENEKEIVYYERDKIEQLPQLLEGLLKDSDKLIDIANAGRMKANVNYDFANMARRIIDIIKEKELAN